MEEYKQGSETRLGIQVETKAKQQITNHLVGRETILLAGRAGSITGRQCQRLVDVCIAGVLKKPVHRRSDLHATQNTHACVALQRQPLRDDVWGRVGVDTNSWAAH